MASELLTVVCAWCERVVTAAPAGAPVTHTICSACLDRLAHPEIAGDRDTSWIAPPPDYFGDAFKY